MAFVKFSRGLTNQYNNLAKKNQDTLYLVYESASSDTGSLYLGDKLISTANISSLHFSDLADISLPEELEDGMLLQYNASTAPGGTGRWEAVPLLKVIGESSSGSGVNVVDDLASIENPQENDVAIQGTELFIYDGSEWEPLTVSDLEDRISNLEDKVGQEANAENGQVATGLYKKLEDLRSDLQAELISQIADAQHLRYQVVENAEVIDLTDEEVTSNTVFLVPKASNDERQDDGYDEYFVINGALEKIGSWDADLTGYVTDDDNRLLSTDDKKKLESIGLNENDQAIIQVAQVGGLNEAIESAQLIKSVDVGTFNITDEGELQLISVPSIDLSRYVQTSVYQAEVGNLADLDNRVSEDSTLVEEINAIKSTLTWQELNKQGE